MTERQAAGSVGQTDPAAAKTLDGDKISTYSKVKNFTSGETNDNIAAVLNILIDESKSAQKSIALVNRKICELSVFLLKDKKAQDRERRF